MVRAVHVGGGHRDEVRERRAGAFGREVQERPGDACRPEEVDLDGAVERRVEAHRGSGVDDDVAGGELAATGVVQAEALACDVAGDRDHPSRHLVVESLAELGAQAVEAVVPQDLATEALGRVGPAPRADEEEELAPGDGAKESLDEGRPEEARRTGDRDAPPGEPISDHGTLAAGAQAPRRGPVASLRPGFTASSPRSAGGGAACSASRPSAGPRLVPVGASPLPAPPRPPAGAVAP